MQGGMTALNRDAISDVLSTPGHLISLAARGFVRLSEARLKPLGFGVGHLPVLVALRDGRAGSQRDLAKFAKFEQPPYGADAGAHGAGRVAKADAGSGSRAQQPASS